MNGSITGIGVMDRIAIAAILAAAILILTMVEVTGRATLPTVPSAAVMAMSTHVDLPVFASSRIRAIAARVAGRS